MRDRLAALAVAVPFLLGAAAAPAADDPDVAFRFRDPAIVESSGLVVQGDAFATTNDSGDTGRVFVVERRGGTTVGVTSWAEEPEDVEALAPAGPGMVWVADIGDNAASRPSVEVHRVRLGTGLRTVEPESFSLTYPDGPVDAEALLRHPRTGRLYVASKVVFGGSLYAAPPRLDPDRPNRLRRVGAVLPVATDGAFFPDGRHLVLRDYGRAVVYSFPGLERVAEVSLPDQQQGEGIAVAADGRVYVSSEGRQAPVLEVRLPARVRTVVDAAPATPTRSSATPSPTTGSREGTELPDAVVPGRPAWPWLFTGVAGVLLVAVLLRALRTR